MERGLRVVGRLGVKVLEGAVDGLIKGFLNVLGPERLGLYIEHNWSILESIFKGIYRPPLEAYRMLKPEEVRKVESIRRNLAKTLLPLLVMARTVASQFPPEVVEAKVTGEWFLSKLSSKYPELKAVIDKYGDRGREWIDRQAQEIRDWLLGRLVFDQNQLKLIKVRAGGEEITVQQVRHK